VWFDGAFLACSLGVLRRRCGNSATDRTGRAATQIAAGTAALIAFGAGASPALAVAFSAGALGVITGAATLLAATAWPIGNALWRKLRSASRRR
jgi:hypothetical protein